MFRKVWSSSIVVIYPNFISNIFLQGQQFKPIATSSGKKCRHFKGHKETQDYYYFNSYVFLTKIFQTARFLYFFCCQIFVSPNSPNSISPPFPIKKKENESLDSGGINSGPPPPTQARACCCHNFAKRRGGRTLHCMLR